MKRPFFSILIPVYKNINFLNDCILSILKQSFNDFEIILCFQGETKPQYTTFDERIKHLYLERPSLYLARIESYKRAIGKYVLFIDSDDELFDGALISLYELIIKTNCCDIYQFNYIENKEKKLYFSDSYFRKTKADYLHYFLAEFGTYPIWRKCFKRKKISFYDEDIFMGEDGLLSLSFIENANEVIITNNVYYFYRPNPKSGTTNLKAKYLDDLCIFLIYTMKYRTSYDEIKMLIFSFITMFLTFYCSLSKEWPFMTNNIIHVIDIVKSYKFITKPLFIKKCFYNIIELKTSKIDFFRLCGFKFFKKMHIRFKVIIDGEVK